MRRFDQILVVDWSAAASPKLGRDSIWIGGRIEGRNGREQIDPVNLATRRQALDWLDHAIRAALASGQRLLIGCDFAFAYPAGTAAALGLPATQPPWRALWDWLAAEICDDLDGKPNANNRFAVAAAANRRMTGGPAPFWAALPGKDGPFLPVKRLRDGPMPVAESRRAERASGSAHSVWKLSTVGAVGSQSLMGIPALHRLRFRQPYGEAVRIWPFEWSHEDNGAKTAQVILAEVYPSLVAEAPGHAVRDAAQVAGLAAALDAADQRGDLAAWLEGHAGFAALPDPEKAIILAEEGWILGVGVSAPLLV